MTALDWFRANLLMIEAELRRLMCEQWIPFALGFARRRWERSGGRLEDWRSDAMFALWLAARGYDPAMPNGFAAYATQCILNQFGREAEKRQHAKHQPPGGSVGSLTGRIGGGFSRPDAKLADPAELASRREEEGRAYRLLQRIRPSYRHVARRLLLEGATLREVAAELGVHQERVRQMKLTAIEDMQILARVPIPLVKRRAYRRMRFGHSKVVQP